MTCRYYAHNGMFGALIPNPGSNQCGLIIASHSPCQMELHGLPVDEKVCPLVAAGGVGLHVEPEAEERSRFHQRIMMIRNIPNTRSGHHLRLECGHEVCTFGQLELSGGVIFCDQCFHASARPKG